MTKSKTIKRTLCLMLAVFSILTCISIMPESVQAASKKTCTVIFDESPNDSRHFREKKVKEGEAIGKLPDNFYAKPGWR